MAGFMFGVIPAGQPLITNPTSTPSPTSFLYALPNTRSYSHIMVILLPDVTLPNDTAAAIYLATTQDVAAAAESGGTPKFKFLGGIGAGKESALFKINSNMSQSSSSGKNDGVVIGVSVEPAAYVDQCLQQLSADKAANAPDPGASQLPPTLLAQRVMQNAYNVLSGATRSVEGVDMVPLRAFDEWWRKFEFRIRHDPNFLTKPQD